MMLPMTVIIRMVKRPKDDKLFLSNSGAGVIPDSGGMMISRSVVVVANVVVVRVVKEVRFEEIFPLNDVTTDVTLLRMSPMGIFEVKLWSVTCWLDGAVDAW